MIPVIICGGIGSKMWPASRQNNPKHFLPLIGGKSLFELNWEALRTKFRADEIYLQTNEVQAEIAKRLVPEIVSENIFVEPEMRNQGPATGFAAAMLIKRGLGNEPFMLIQADLIRTDNEKFLVAMEMADEIARKEKVYCTGGMKPKSVIEGVDYLVKGDLIKDVSGVKLYRIADYIDRSEKERVREMINAENLLLHWNHTAITPNNLLDLFKRFKMEWYEPLMKIATGGDEVENYALLPKGPIEEVTSQVERLGEAVVMEFPFEIWDFGTWESVSKYLNTSDENGNFVKTKKHTEIIGLNDLVVVETDDALLIVPKKDSGRVGEVVDKLKAEGKTELL